jgi:hypothetical protein
VLAGEDEARLTFLAVRRWFGWSAGRLAVFDIGGGSLEIASGADEEPEAAWSMPLGAARLARVHFQETRPSDEALRNLRKEIRALTPAAVRLEMVEAAVGDVEGIEASAIEIERGGTSYPADTLAALEEREPDADLFVVLGSDAAAGLPTWERADEVRRLSTLVVVTRPGAEDEGPPDGWECVGVEAAAWWRSKRLAAVSRGSQRVSPPRPPEYPRATDPTRCRINSRGAPKRRELRDARERWCQRATDLRCRVRTHFIHSWG